MINNLIVVTPISFAKPTFNESSNFQHVQNS